MPPSIARDSRFQSHSSVDRKGLPVFQVGRKRTAPWGPIDKAAVTRQINSFI